MSIQYRLYWFIGDADGRFNLKIRSSIWINQRQVQSCKISIESMASSPFSLNWCSFSARSLIFWITWFLIFVIVNAIIRPTFVSNLISVKSFCGMSSLAISIAFNFQSVLFIFNQVQQEHLVQPRTPLAPNILCGIVRKFPYGVDGFHNL